MGRADAKDMDARAQRQYREETLALIARRGPISVAVFLLGVIVADVLETHYHPERLGYLAAISSLEVAIGVAMLFVYRAPRLRPWIIEFTQGMGIALLLCATAYIAATGAGPAALALVVIGVELSTAMMFPWGTRGQLPLAAACVTINTAYVVADPPAADTTLPVSYCLFAVVFGAVFSVFAARFLDRQRFRIHAQRAKLDGHVAAFRELTETFHGFDPQRALLVTCTAMLRLLPLRRLWAAWRVLGDGAVHGYMARRDGDDVQLEALGDTAPFSGALGALGDSMGACVAARGDPRLPGVLLNEVSSTLLVPIRFEKETLGAMWADCGDKALELGEQELRLATVLTGGVAIAMANARLYHQAAAASDEKSTFLAHVAHELRNPLHTLLWDIDTLQTERAGPRPVLQRLRQNALMTLATVKELQEFAEVETRRLTTSPEPVDLVQVFDELRATAVALIDGDPVAVRSRVEPGAEIVISDPMRVRQVLGNLLSNAAKFTARGSIELEARRVGSDIVIRIADTGVGIAPDQIDAIFRPFYRASGHGTSGRRGMGLGLAIAQEIAVLLGGRLEVESTVGVGTTFVLRLPLGETAARSAALQESRQAPRAGRRSAAA